MFDYMQVQQKLMRITLLNSVISRSCKMLEYYEVLLTMNKSEIKHICKKQKQ